MEEPLLKELTHTLLGVRSNLYERDFWHPALLANEWGFYITVRTRIRTPLFLVVCCGHVKAIEVLLKHGACTQGPTGIMTPVHAAAC